MVPDAKYLGDDQHLIKLKQICSWFGSTPPSDKTSLTLLFFFSHWFCKRSKVMGEYIEPSATTWVSQETEKPHDGVWPEHMAVCLPPSTRHEEVIVLAWTLLLFRGAVNSEDGSFCWTKGDISQTCLIADLVEGEDSSLRSALEAIRERGQFDEEISDTLVFKNASLEHKVRWPDF